jgi:hypothetical protein
MSARRQPECEAFHSAEEPRAVCCDQNDREERSMLRLTLRYSRYALMALASVGFKLAAN